MMKLKRVKKLSLGINHRGHAALLFVLIFPAMFGMFVWGTEGARIMQDKARLGDAMEVAGLAVAAENSDDPVTQRDTAKKFLKTYFTNSTTTISNPTVKKLTCEKNPKCDQNDPNVARFFEYQVTATVTQNIWFDGAGNFVDYGGEDKKYTVSDKSVARKYQSQAVDVVLVADYSASMYQGWDGGDNKKFKDLNNIISDVAIELKKFNEQNIKQVNKIAVVPFDYYTSEKNKEGERRFSANIYCGDSYESDCYSKYPAIKGRPINPAKTVSRIFSDFDSIHQYKWKVKDVTNISIFENIYLTSDFEKDVIDKITKKSLFDIPKKSGSGTASYTGLIKGAQVAAQGSNPRRLIIILSDGVDSYSEITDSLIDAGLCTKIIGGLNSLKTSSGDNVKAKLAAVGFDYDVDSNPQMERCVGKNNVYKAENSADIKNKILELISEEIGHLAE